MTTIDFAEAHPNCYFISNLHAIAAAYPGYLESLVQDHGDGTYTVTFHNKTNLGFKKHEEVVDDRFPSSTLEMLSKDGDKDILAIYLIEKAFSRWQGSYANMEWGNPVFAMEALTGQNASLTFVHAHSEDYLFEKIKEAFEEGRPIVTGTFDLMSIPEVKDFLKRPIEKKNERRKLKGRDALEVNPESSQFAPRGILQKWLYRRITYTGRYGDPYWVTDQHNLSVMAIYEEEGPEGLRKMIALRDPRYPTNVKIMPISEYRKQFFHLVIGTGSRDMMMEQAKLRLSKNETQKLREIKARDANKKWAIESSEERIDMVVEEGFHAYRNTQTSNPSETNISHKKDSGSN